MAESHGWRGTVHALLCCLYKKGRHAIQAGWPVATFGGPATSLERELRTSSEGCREQVKAGIRSCQSVPFSHENGALRAGRRIANSGGSAFLLLREVVRLHGVPAAFVSGHDSSLTSEMWQYMWHKLSIQHEMPTAHHPQTDGQAERTYQTTDQRLGCVILGDDAEWSDLLPVL